jgi:TolB-like protein/tetratricopeptide (TPR) repeat protein
MDHQSERFQALSDLLRAVVQAPVPGPERVEVDPLLPGDTVGRFELLAEIGRGGFGIVYEARDRELGRVVALKVIRRDLAQGDAAREEALQREAEAIAQLHHPSIVTLYDFGRCDSGPYLVLELLHGETLARRLTGGPLPLPEALRLAIQVAEALVHAHGRGVLHRDLKPSNVHVSPGGIAKVLDFGIAHVFGRPRLEGAGTPRYMAPEQVHGREESDRTDVHALALMFVETVTGAVLDRKPGDVLGNGTPGPALRVAGAPAVLSSSISRALDPDPARRPSAAELLADMIRVEHRLRSRETLRRGLWRYGWAIVLAAFLLVGVIARPWREGAQRPASPPTTIGVIPLHELDPRQDHRMELDGLSDEIRLLLARNRALRVLGPMSSYMLRGKDEAVELERARRLGLGSILRGNVQRDGSRVQLAIRLVRVSDGAQLWSMAHDGDVSELFDLESRIAIGVAEAIGVPPTPPAELSRRPDRTGNTGAHIAYLRGRGWAAGNFTSRAEWEEAVREFEQAVSLDPGYAAASASLAVALANAGRPNTTFRATPGHPGDLQRAMVAAERAVAFSPDLSDGYLARGQLRLSMNRDWAGAMADFEQAHRELPGDPEAEQTYAEKVLARRGQLQAAIVLAGQASDIDPWSFPPYVALCRFHLAARDTGRARAVVARLQEIGIPIDRSPLRTGCLSRLALLEGRPADAVEMVQTDLVGVERKTIEAAAFHDLGRDAESLQALQFLLVAHDQDQAARIAAVHAWRGEPDEAFRWLDRALAQREEGVLDVEIEPLFQKLHGDPRWTELRARIGLASP